MSRRLKALDGDAGLLAKQETTIRRTTMKKVAVELLSYGSYAVFADGAITSDHSPSQRTR